MSADFGENFRKAISNQGSATFCSAEESEAELTRNVALRASLSPLASADVCEESRDIRGERVGGQSWTATVCLPVDSKSSKRERRDFQAAACRQSNTVLSVPTANQE